jgi:glycosyltransferase involved in cell wall biosynthesis
MKPRGSNLHRVSVVIPVYQGERTLPELVQELAVLSAPTRSAAGHEFVVVELLLVSDRGPDRSDAVIRDLAVSYDFVRPIWLSRNFGQHPATLAGMASSSGDWIVTMDEDGQHDPAFIGDFLDVALARGLQLVYANPINRSPHGKVRNGGSRLAKGLSSKLSPGGNLAIAQSYRLVLGEVGRSVAAYAGSGVYLDVALGWVTGPAAVCPVELRREGDRPSGYSLRRLVSHFWNLIISSGTRPLRLVSVLGGLFVSVGMLFTLYLIIVRFTAHSIPQGWTSVMVLVLVSTGAILFSLGIIAEYVGVAVSMAMGKPLYLIIADPNDGPLGRDVKDAP